MSSTSEDNLQLVSMFDTEIMIQAIVSEAVGQPETVSEVANYSFVPAFYLQTTELHVSNMQPSALIKLTANSRVLKDLVVSLYKLIDN